MKDNKLSNISLEQLRSAARPNSYDVGPNPTCEVHRSSLRELIAERDEFLSERSMIASQLDLKERFDQLEKDFKLLLQVSQDFKRKNDIMQTALKDIEDSPEPGYNLRKKAEAALEKIK